MRLMACSADNLTLHAFEKTNATDTGGLIVFDRSFMRDVRRVKPHKIRMLRDFIVEDSLPSFDGEESVGPRM